MRRFLDWTAQQASSTNQLPPNNNSSTTNLELQHLSRLLADIKTYQACPLSSTPHNQTEFIDKIHRTLPLFLKVFSPINLLSVQQQQYSDEISSSSAAKQQESLSAKLAQQKLNLAQLDNVSNLLPFAYTVARLFVSEIRQRASNKRAGEASQSILHYLEIPTSPYNNQDATTTTDCNNEKNSSVGWNLLLTLNVLISASNKQIISLLCDASLPSTLVKCLYLFFDLPIATEDVFVTTPTNTNVTKSKSILQQTATMDLECENSTRERRTILTNHFTQLLVRLCSNQAAIDELVKKDDLSLLMSIASSQCPKYNQSWRATASQTILAISSHVYTDQHAMVQNFRYLEQKSCIQVYVDNMQRLMSLSSASTEELVEMLSNLIDFIYNLDVNNPSHGGVASLMNQFRASQSADLIIELIKKVDYLITSESGAASFDLDQDAIGTRSIQSTGNSCDYSTQSLSKQPSATSEAGLDLDRRRKHGKTILQLLTQLSKINSLKPDESQLKINPKPSAIDKFEMLEQFRLPRPTAKHHIRNLDVIDLLKIAWSRCNDDHMVEATLDSTISLFNDDKSNYFIFENEQLLLHFLNNDLVNKPYKIQQKLFKFIEFAIIETHYIPCQELAAIKDLIGSEIPDSTLILCLRTFVSCLKFNHRFSDIYRELGILNTIESHLIYTIQQELLDDPEKLLVLYLLFETSLHLLVGPNNQNCTHFNESGATRHVFNCLASPKFFNLIAPNQGSSSDDGHSHDTPPPSAHSTNHQSRCHSRFTSQRTLNKPSVKQLRKMAFAIIRQLILSSAGDEHLANLLGLLARNLDDLKTIDDSSTDMLEPSENSSMHNSPNMIKLISQEVHLKTSILKSLMIILKESHRCRTLFRKVGGFVYIVSVLVTMEKCLPSCETPINADSDFYKRWRQISNKKIWYLIKSALSTIVVSMRSEPANLRFFTQDISSKFTDSLHLLGCFHSRRTLSKSSTFSLKAASTIESIQDYKNIFLMSTKDPYSLSSNADLKPAEACCRLFRYLYDMALDKEDGPVELDQLTLSRSPMKDPTNDVEDPLDNCIRESQTNNSAPKPRAHAKRPPSLDLKSQHQKPAIIVFPCVVMTIMDLIPSCPDEELTYFMTEVVRSLLKHERNQQLLCEIGFISELLQENWRIALIDQDHYLHEPCQFMFERLSTQLITPKELKSFLRLTEPLQCKNLDDIEFQKYSRHDQEQRSLSKLTSQDSKRLTITENGELPSTKEKISTSRLSTLVAMMASKKSTNEFNTQPPFIEIDMRLDGFSTLFMPSIAPVNAKSLPVSSSTFLNNILDVHTQEKNGILGGIGSTERTFPPTSGLTFSTWIYIDQFPPRSNDPMHNIRLLTLYRGSASTGKEFSCFKIQISAADRALLVSTQEILLYDDEQRSSAIYDPDCNLRVWSPHLLMEDRWHHVVVTLNRSLLKQSTIFVYIDGQLAHSQRINYISNYVGSITSSTPTPGSGGGSASSASAAFVNGFIGSLPQLRLQLRSAWRQGAFHLIEEPSSSTFVSVVYNLGPAYIGNFQSSTRLNELLRQLNPNASSSQNHKALFHQQSTSAVSTNTYHHPHLTRISSSAAASTSQPPSPIPSTASLVVLEERVLMSIDARSTSILTLARMRRIYTRFDCRQVSRVMGLAVHENATPVMLLHNTSGHLNGSSRGIGAIAVGFSSIRCFVPSPTQEVLYNIGGCAILIGLVAQAETIDSFCISMKALVCALRLNSKLQTQMNNMNGYQILAVFFWKKKTLINSHILHLSFSLVTDCVRQAIPKREQNIREIHQVTALRDLICDSFDLWLEIDLINPVLEFIHELVAPVTQPQPKTEQNENVSSADNLLSINGDNLRLKNLKLLREMDLLPRLLILLKEHSVVQATLDIEEQTGGSDDSSLASKSFDAKTIYLIKQIVYELLNRTPRQTDILYFGQYLASMMPADNQERPKQIINLRNILLKSLLQMMTRNNQNEINQATQEELVRILGFDWFLLFINGSYLDSDTVTIGLVNFMIILSNDILYNKLKLGNNNGGWLKQPSSSSIDGRFNMQLLGFNVGALFGMAGKRKSIKQEVIDAPGFYLLSCCLTNLVDRPRIYIILCQAMMNHFSKLSPTVLDTIENFDKLSLDTLCDCLVGETHHKRRVSLSTMQFKCRDLIVCIVYMIRDLIWRQGFFPAREEHAESLSNSFESTSKSPTDIVITYPIDIIKFLMYFYNNHQGFQTYCKTNKDLVDAIAETLMKPDYTSLFPHPVSPAKIASSNGRKATNSVHEENEFNSMNTASNSLSYDDNLQETTQSKERPMTEHPARSVILEFSRLIILDSMTDQEFIQNSQGQLIDSQMQAFERFLEALSPCKRAQGELIQMLMRQILLIIDSTARHHTMQTISTADNKANFQSLLANSILVSQIVVDKIWLNELYKNDLKQVTDILDYQLSLFEQILKFNDLLPRQMPTSAQVMQRTMNRVILFALSRPVEHMSDKLLILELLRKIYAHRQLIIHEHIQGPHSAEFFVCLTYCLMQMIDEGKISNTSRSVWYANLPPTDQPNAISNDSVSHQSQLDDYPTSVLMITSIARKIWDETYKGKKSILSEALGVNLSVPAFSLETSLDLSQLRPTIHETCLRVWLNYIDQEQKVRKPKPLKSSESLSIPGTSSAAQILSGRLTKVVNAANFVSRVVGATAGSVASGVGNTEKNQFKKEIARTTSDCQNTSSQNNSASNGSSSFRCFGLSKATIEKALQTHISIINDWIELQSSQSNQNLALHKYVCEEWLECEYEVLLREKALFGPEHGSQLNKWSLDLTEGPRRMRKKLINNTKQFYENYPYSAELYNPDNKSLKYRPPMSYDSHEYYKKTIAQDKCLLDIRETVPLSPLSSQTTTSTPLPPVSDEKRDNNRDSDLDRQCKTPEHDSISHHMASNALMDPRSSIESIQHLGISPSQRSCSMSNQSQDQEDGETSSFVDVCQEAEAESNLAQEESIDSQTVIRLLERNERISHMFRCCRVQGLDTYEGLLLFGREHFYLIDGFTLLKTREIKDIDSLPGDVHDPIIPNSTPNIRSSHTKKSCAKFALDTIVEVHKRRYLLQPIALEVFSLDGRNTLIAFPRNIRNKVYSRFMSMATQLTNNAQDSLAGQKLNVSVEGGGGLLSSLIGETSVTQRWIRGEISNFQYLMNLNTIAGRSYNDLMQYPIFPWILADYSSSSLDLANPVTFRDLSRPVGAQTKERLEQFKKRYAEWDDTETPPYHYGTFYSSAMIVASYLVRMEPFTQHFLRLQGGHFDLADRMFHSIGDSWLSASKHNMADIKELIPEFFYLPEFLLNSNKFDLGIKQSGNQLDNVILPPWAKGDPREFIRLNRCALESDYVSCHLHEWIDLIFGYKQQGQAAVDAVNVFHHLFYEGNVDIYNTDIDPIKKNAVIGFINNFGQVPKQLFKKPHPVRKVHSGLSPLPLTPILPSLAGSSSQLANKVFIYNLNQLRQNNTSYKDVRGAVGQIVQVDKNLVAVEQNKILIPPEYCRYIAWGFADRSLRLGLYDSERPIFIWEGDESHGANEILCCTIPNNRTMITAGTDSLITVWKIEKMRSFTPMLNLYGHVEPITCLASSQAYSMIVSGSRDRTAVIWDLNRFTFVRQLGGGSSQNLVHSGPISAIAINELTGDIATCASSGLYLWSINGELLAKVDSNCGLNRQVSMRRPNSTGQQQILSVAFSQYNEWNSDEVILTGSSDGAVLLWSLRYIQQKDLSNKNGQRDRMSDRSSMTSSCDSNNSDEHENVINAEYPSDWVQLSSSASTTIRVTQENQNVTPSRATSANSDNTTISGGANEHIQQQQHHQQQQQQGQLDDVRSKSTNPSNNSLSPSNVATNSQIRFSRSDTSLVESFVLLSTSPASGSALNNQASNSNTNASNRNINALANQYQDSLLPGHSWKRELHLRAKLVRKNNANVAVTALAISKDHRVVYVGDASGRISSWSVP